MTTTLFFVILGVAFATLNIMKVLVYLDTPKCEKKTRITKEEKTATRYNEFDYMFYSKEV